MSSWINKLTGHHSKDKHLDDKHHHKTSTTGTSGTTGSLGTTGRDAKLNIGGTGANLMGSNQSGLNTHGVGRTGAAAAGAAALGSGIAGTGFSSTSSSHTGSHIGTGSTMGTGSTTGHTMGSSHLGTGKTTTSSAATTGATGSTMAAGSRLDARSNLSHSGIGARDTAGIAGRDNAMTRSEEQLRVGKETVPAGTAALNKYVTTEHVEKSVPVTREHVVVQREPITDKNLDKALSGPDIRENRYETTVYEERAVAAKETVPIERVRLAKVKEHTQDTVSADLRKEHIDVVDNTRDKVLEAAPGTTKTDHLNAGINTAANSRTGLRSDNRPQRNIM